MPLDVRRSAHMKLQRYLDRINYLAPSSRALQRLPRYRKPMFAFENLDVQLGCPRQPFEEAYEKMSLICVVGAMNRTDFLAGHYRKSGLMFAGLPLASCARKKERTLKQATSAC